MSDGNGNENGAKVKAQNALNYAVASGRITRPEACERCNKTGIMQGHHHSYAEEHWLDVEWLCKTCHIRVHKEMEQAVRGEVIRNSIIESGTRPASSFQGNPRNWRKHPQHQRDAVAASLRELGWIAPVIENRRTGHLIDGHERVWQALQANDAEVPYVLVDLPEHQEHLALTIFDPIAALAETDRDVLAALMDDVRTGEAALQEMIAELAEAEGILDAAIADTSEPPEAQTDRAEELREQWKTETGQKWQIGNHLLLCADSTDETSVQSLIGEVEVGAYIHDPPWDAELDFIIPDHLSALVFGDGGNVGNAVDLFGVPAWVYTWDCVTSWWTNNRPLRRAKLCLWYGDISTYDADGSHYGEPETQAKVVSNSRGSYEYQPDPRGKHLADVYTHAITQLHNDGPSHSKPVDWVRMLIANCTTGLVYDPFLGTGTTMAAAEQVGRVCYGVEIDPSAVAVILQRMSEMGITPELAS
jgi:hypothetical protein